MSVSDKILNKFSERLAGSSDRADLKIVDFHPIGDGKSAGLVMLEFRAGTKPNAIEVEKFFIKVFGNSIKPQLTTIKFHSGEGYQCLTLQANTQVITRPISDASNMVRINPLTYLEASTNAMWNVAQSQEGIRYLVREGSEDLSQVIEARKSRTSRSVPKIASLKEALCHCEVGDHVKFFDNGLVCYGEIVCESDGKTVDIKTNTGVCTVDYKAVLNVVQRSQKTMSDEKDKLEQYFEKAYGNQEFAHKLTDQLAIEKNDGKTGIPLEFP